MAPTRAKKVTLTVKKPLNPNPATGTGRTRRTTSSANANNFVLDPQLRDEARSTSPQVTNGEPVGTSARPAVTQVNPAADGREQDPNATEFGEIAAMRGTSDSYKPIMISTSLVHDIMLIAYE
jgi:hypothetical protein